MMSHLARHAKSGHSITMFTTSLPASDSSVLNLQRLVMLRSVFIAGQVLAVWVAGTALDITLPFFAIVAIIAAYAVLNALTWWRLRLPQAVVDAELFGHLLLDVAVLTGLLYLAGGSANPFVSLLLLPLTIAVTALPGRYSWVMAAITVACYSALMVFYVPLSQDPAPHLAGDFALHVLGMWFNFVLSVGLITYFVMKMGNTLRERDRALAQARENALRDERLVALGTLATGAAHELGTPLATMAVLAKEMQAEVEQARANTPDMRDKLIILRDQVMRCKSILSTMAASVGQVRAESGQRFALDDYLKNIMHQWQAMRPAVIVQYHAHGAHPAPSIVGDQTLSQAIINILNNAADASPDHVTIDARWSVNELRMEICDRGAGLTPMTQARAGQMLFTTKVSDEIGAGGLGLGLFLAHATLGRFGGSVKLGNREGGGACTYVVLPLAQLMP